MTTDANCGDYRAKFSSLANRFECLATKGIQIDERGSSESANTEQSWLDFDVELETIRNARRADLVGEQRLLLDEASEACLQAKKEGVLSIRSLDLFTARSRLDEFSGRDRIGVGSADSFSAPLFSLIAGGPCVEIRSSGGVVRHYALENTDLPWRVESSLDGQRRLGILACDWFNLPVVSVAQIKHYAEVCRIFARLVKVGICHQNHEEQTQISEPGGKLKKWEIALQWLKSRSTEGPFTSWPDLATESGLKQTTLYDAANNHGTVDLLDWTKKPKPASRHEFTNQGHELETNTVPETQRIPADERQKLTKQLLATVPAQNRDQVQEALDGLTDDKVSPWLELVVNDHDVREQNERNRRKRPK